MNETRINLDYLKQNKLIETNFEDYYTYWNSSIDNKGYSGVSILTKIKPNKFFYGIYSPYHDREGRVITLEFDSFFLVCVYVPNSGDRLKRLNYRVNEWDIKFFDYANKLKRIKNVIITGDLNVAHTVWDVYDPYGKENQAGFTLHERNSFQNFLNLGFIDTYRHFYPDKKEFTFWANRTKSRYDNRGWRIDYFIVNDSKDHIERILDCEILTNYYGSDHCPIKLSLNV